MNQLEKARETIDAVDGEIARLFCRRLDAVKDVIAYKMENHLPVYDGAREEAVIEKNRARLERAEYTDLYEDLIRFIMKQSKIYQRSLQSKGRVAYAGVEGAFAHMVSERLFADSDKKACMSFEEVIQNVLDRKVEYGILPFENTNSGLVGEVLDALAEYPVYITQVADVKIDQCLLGLPEASLKDIEWVYSKDQALNQAKEFLDSLQVECVPYPNTALAAQYVAKCQDKTKAAIGAKENAVLYGLKVLASHIEANASNTTRFLVISAEKPHWDGDHFSMIVTVANEVGSLAKVIEVIARHNLNMDCIQSRPRKGRPFEYVFYIQCVGQVEQKNIEEFLKDLEQVCTSIKWMGTYAIKKESEEQ